MPKRKYPRQKELKALFDYRKDGVLIWKIKTANRVNINYVAGCIDKINGYRRVGIKNILYSAHVLIWIWHYGYNPENDIDHINRNGLDDRIENLREATRSCNVRNTGNGKANTSGVKGVTWDNKNNKWRPRIYVNGSLKYLGYYDDYDEAVLYRFAAEQCVDWSRCDLLSPAHDYVIKNNLIKQANSINS